MKKIVVKYIIEVPENHIDKVCRVARCGKRDLENDIKEHPIECTKCDNDDMDMTIKEMK